MEPHLPDSQQKTSHTCTIIHTQQQLWDHPHHANRDDLTTGLPL